MRICVATMYTADIANYGVLSAENKVAYARRHGYEAVIVRDTLDPSRVPAWSKVRLLIDLVEQFDWVFWTDADSLVMNSRVALTSLISEAGDVDMILGSDVVSPVNTGHWLVKNCEWTKLFLRRVWDEPPDPTRRAPPWDQGSVTRILAGDSSARDRVRILPPRALNSTVGRYFKPTGLGSNWETIYRAQHRVSEYRPGDFIIHFMFCKDPRRRYAGMAAYHRRWRACED